MAKELSKDDLLKLLGANLKKPRKKRDISEEQREELIARLAKMREKAKEVRVEKAKMKKEIVERDDEPEPTKKSAPLIVKPQVDDELFEKKFSNRFDKMDDIMMRLDTRLEEITKAKKEKREAKAKAEAEAEARKVKQEAQDLENRKEIKPLEQVKPVINYNAIPKIPDYRKMMIKKKY